MEKHIRDIDRDHDGRCVFVGLLGAILVSREPFNDYKGVQCCRWCAPTASSGYRYPV